MSHLKIAEIKTVGCFYQFCSMITNLRNEILCSNSYCYLITFGAINWNHVYIYHAYRSCHKIIVGANDLSPVTQVLQ